MLTRPEVSAVFGELASKKLLITNLLYGSGLRLLEALRLRVKDVLVERHELVVRSGKGGEDRVTILPASVKSRVAAQLRAIAAQDKRDALRGAGWVDLPTAIALIALPSICVAVPIRRRRIEFNWLKLSADISGLNDALEAPAR